MDQGKPFLVAKMCPKCRGEELIVVKKNGRLAGSCQACLTVTPWEKLLTRRLDDETKTPI